MKLLYWSHFCIIKVGVESSGNKSIAPLIGSFHDQPGQGIKEGKSNYKLFQIVFNNVLLSPGNSTDKLNAWYIAVEVSVDYPWVQAGRDKRLIKV